MPKIGLRDMRHDMPHALRERLAGYDEQRTTIGRSGADMYRLASVGRPTVYLKVGRSAPVARDVADEAERLEWLRTRLPVPEVVWFQGEGPAAWLLTTALSGEDATSRNHGADVPQLVRLLADGLRMIHAVPVADCPFDHRVSAEISRAEGRVRRGVVDETDFDLEQGGQSAGLLLEAVRRSRPATEDVVLTHGDYCLPNVLVQDGRLGGFVDLARAGRGDRYRDLALVARSLASNWGPEWVPRLFSECGLPNPDEEKLRFYRLLDEFF